jgi:hypothetical protein
VGVKEEGIGAISDLIDRVILHDEYEKFWIERCQKEAERLKEFTFIKKDLER